MKLKLVLICGIVGAIGDLAPRATRACEPPVTKEDRAISQDIDIRRRNGHTKVISSLSYSNDSKLLAAASFDGNVRLYNPDATKLLRTIRTSSREVYAIAFSPDDKLLATGGSACDIELWHVATGEKVHVLKGHGGAVPALAFSRDGKLLASGSYDKTIRVWDTAGWKEKLKITEGLDRVTSVAFSPDGKMLASAGTTVRTVLQIQVGEADFVRLWDVATGKRMKELSIRGSQVAIAPDGRSIFASGLALQVKREPDDVDIQGYSGLRWQSLEVNCTLLDTTGQSRGCTFAHSADWRWFAATDGIFTTFHFTGNTFRSDRADNGTFWFWESSTRSEPLKLRIAYENKHDYETVAAFSTDGKHLAIGSFWGIVEVRALHPELKNGLGAGISAAPMSPDEWWLALGSSKAHFAYAAIWQMLKAPTESVKLLRIKLRPVPLDKVNSWKSQIVELGDREFRVRQKAFAELQKVSWSVFPQLRQEHARTTNATSRKALSDLIVQLLSESVSPDGLSQNRSVYLLQSINTRESRQLLEELANGAVGATLTEDAKAALERLGPKPVK
jgi:WD40 repeat protein